MQSIAAATAHEQLAGPLGTLTREAEARASARIVEVVDSAVEKLQARHVGFDPRSADFIAFLNRFGVGDADATTADRLEEAAVAYQAVRGRAERAEAERERQQFWTNLRNADTGTFRVGIQ